MNVVFEDKVYTNWCDTPVIIRVFEDNSLEQMIPHGNGGYCGKQTYTHYRDWLNTEESREQDYQEVAAEIRYKFKVKPAAPESFILCLKNNWTPPTCFNFDRFEWPEDVQVFIDRIKKES